MPITSWTANKSTALITLKFKTPKSLFQITEILLTNLHTQTTKQKGQRKDSKRLAGSTLNKEPTQWSQASLSQRIPTRKKIMNRLCQTKCWYSRNPTGIHTIQLLKPLLFLLGGESIYKMIFLIILFFFINDKKVFPELLVTKFIYLFGKKIIPLLWCPKRLTTTTINK